MTYDKFDPADPIAERKAVANGITAWLSAILRNQLFDGSVNDGAFDEYSTGWYDGRHTAYTLGHLIAAWSWRNEIDSDVPQLERSIRAALAFICRRQAPDGRMDLGGMYSPNEVGFTLPALASGYTVLRNAGVSFDDILPDLKNYLLKGAEAVLAGHAYTANHRWAAASGPLAAVHALWPDQRYLDKIECYLSEDIDCDSDGCWYEERSPNYNTVANSGIVVIADNLNRPELLDIVVRSHEFILHAIQPNGEADSSFSHRQDRHGSNRPLTSYGLARRVAQLTGDGRYTALAADAWSRQAGRTSDLIPLAYELDSHTSPVPPGQPLPTNYERFFRSASIARVRDDDRALTLAADPGGHFYDTVRDQWGGAKRSDDWLHVHYGDVVIESIHLAGAGMSNVQPQQIEQVASGQYAMSGYVKGWTHTLHFSSGSPPLEMNWDWSHEIEVTATPNSVGVSVSSNSPHSLAAMLWIYIRPGVRLNEGENETLLEAGKAAFAVGGRDIVLTGKNSTLTIRGLPKAAHHWPILISSSIPSPMQSQCARIGLGLLFPVELKFEVLTSTK